MTEFFVFQTYENIPNIYFHTIDKKYIGLHVKYSLFLSDFNKLDFYQQIFEKY
jgi:hypothetical protein